jgi:hypothetical protein
VLFRSLLWVVLIGLPNRAAVATDLRIWPSEQLGSIRAIVHRIAVFPFRNDSFTLLAAPILIFGGLGWLASVVGRRNLPRSSIVLLAVATGWAVAGFAVLAVVPYRPNRYEVPLLPALAVLGALGWSLLEPRLVRAPRMRPAAFGPVLAAAALVVPGLFSFGTWVANTPSTLPAIQASVRAIVPAGADIQGSEAPAFGLQTEAVTLVNHDSTRVNPGDLYASRDVRWYLGPLGTAPAWATLHPAAWADRVTRLCAPWGGQQLCLWQLP